VQLAEEIVGSRNSGAIQELVENLSNEDKEVQGDCIKVLYKVGERQPKLIAIHVKDFGVLLGSKNRRLLWGAMTALHAVTAVAPTKSTNYSPKY
jgi:hypothetical protein